MNVLPLFILLILAHIGWARFSIGYLSGSSGSTVVNAGMELESTPDALHVADLYARLSGLPPLLATRTCQRVLLI